MNGVVSMRSSIGSRSKEEEDFLFVVLGGWVSGVCCCVSWKEKKMKK